jgi:hypothetical protein
LPLVTTQAQDIAPGLQWENTSLEIKTEGTAPSDVIFRFRNTGTQPVVIQSVNTTCGCTVSQPAKKQYAPGESGVLPVTHKPRPGPGVRSYRINVQTNEGGGRLHTLILRVTNQPRFFINPRLIVWEKDEARGPKSLEVRIKKGEPSKLTGFQADKDVLDIRIEEKEPGLLTLFIAPKPGVSVVPGRVRVQLLTEPALPPSMDTQFFVIFR